MRCVHPASTSPIERDSFRNTAPEKPVRIGAMKVNTVASDNDKYCKEKYIPETIKNL